MNWNVEAQELIKLLDDKVMSIVTDQDYVRGFCETCDFGSMYVQTITVTFEDGDKVTYEFENNYEYALNEAKLMRFFTNNLENFAQMTRYDFLHILRKTSRARRVR